MTLLERDREKLEEGREEGREEGIELAKKVFKLLNKGESISNIAKICKISEEKVKKMENKMIDTLSLLGIQCYSSPPPQSITPYATHHTATIHLP